MYLGAEYKKEQKKLSIVIPFMICISFNARNVKRVYNKVDY